MEGRGSSIGVVGLATSGGVEDAGGVEAAGGAEAGGDGGVAGLSAGSAGVAAGGGAWSWSADSERAGWATRGAGACSDSVRRSCRAAAGGRCARSWRCRRRDSAGVSPDSARISRSENSIELRSKSERSSPLSTFDSEFCWPVRCLPVFLLLPEIQSKNTRFDHAERSLSWSIYSADIANLIGVRSSIDSEGKLRAELPGWIFIERFEYRTEGASWAQNQFTNDANIDAIS